MYSVHCRVIVDSKSEFYHSSHVDCTFNARLVSTSGRTHKSEKARLLTVSCPNISIHRGVYNHSLVLEKRLLSLSSSRIHGLKVIASSKVGVSQFTKFRAAFCHCFASWNCCRGPFIVRSAQTCPPFTGFTQLAHPSRCSRSTLTAVCFCACFSVFTSGLCVYIGSLFGSAAPSPHPSLASSPSSCSGVWDPWSIDYQSCKLAMLL